MKNVLWWVFMGVIVALTVAIATGACDGTSALN